MTMDEAGEAMRKLLPGQGGWADWSALDVKEAQVGVLEHTTKGPASRIILGRSRKGFGDALQAAKEKIASWDKPKEPKPKEKDPNELPQEELFGDPPGA